MVLSQIIQVTQMNINILFKDKNIWRSSVVEDIKFGTSEEYIIDKFGIPK